MAESEFTAVTPLDGGHDRVPFDCRVPALNLYLRNYALQNQKKGIVRNYVTTRAKSKVVVAYYSLVYAVIDQKRLPAKLVKGLGKYDIPVMLLARLAVDPKGCDPAHASGGRNCRSETPAGTCQGRSRGRLLP